MAEEPKGIGGWLAALLVAIGGVGPLFYGWVIWSALSVQAKLAEFGAEGYPLYTFQTVLWALSLFKLVVAWSVAGAMLRFRTRAVLRFAIAGIWLLAIGTIPIDLAALALSGAEGLMPQPGIVGIWIAEGLVLAIPATLYLLRSRRVANTYRPEPDDDGLAEIFE